MGSASVRVNNNKWVPQMAVVTIEGKEPLIITWEQFMELATCCHEFENGRTKDVRIGKVQVNLS